MLAQVDPDRLQRLEIQLLHPLRRRLQDDLKLRVLEQPVRVFAIAPIRRTTRRLRIANVKGFGPSTRRNVSGDIVPAPTSTSYGCCSTQPRSAQNLCSETAVPETSVRLRSPRADSK